MQASLYPNADSARGLMADLWRQSLQVYASNDPLYGYRLKEDFSREPCVPGVDVGGTTLAATVTGTTTAHQTMSGWVAQDAVTAGGTFTLSKNAGPEAGVKIASNGTTADFGSELGIIGNPLAAPSHSSAPSRRLVAQFRIDEGSVNGQTLAVLTDASATTPIAGANDAIADVGYVGFQIDEDGDLNFVTKSATSGTSDSVEVLESANFTRGDAHEVGFAINSDLSVDIVVDNVWYGVAGRSVNKAALPTGNLAPRFASTSSGTTAADLTVMNVDVFASRV